jgi:hypothetical protein
MDLNHFSNLVVYLLIETERHFISVDVFDVSHFPA